MKILELKLRIKAIGKRASIKVKKKRLEKLLREEEGEVEKGEDSLE